MPCTAVYRNPAQFRTAGSPTQLLQLANSFIDLRWHIQHKRDVIAMERQQGPSLAQTAGFPNLTPKHPSTNNTPLGIWIASCVAMPLWPSHHLDRMVSGA